MIAALRTKALGALALAVLGGLMLATLARPAEAQAVVTTLSQLRTAAGEDPRADIGRLRIPSIGVDAAYGAHSVEDGGVMPNPYGPGDVAWYEFATTWFGGTPGTGQNAVMSGHVNYNANVSYAGVRYRGAGVFARLGELEPGDLIEVDRDGQTYRFMVSWSRTMPAVGDSSWGSILSSVVPTDSLTLYTCDGTFDGRTLEFSHRYAVRAERVDGTPNRIPDVGRVTFGISRTNHPAALAQAQTYPVESIFAQDPDTGRWLVYRPGAPSFANTLMGRLRIGSPVMMVRGGVP